MRIKGHNEVAPVDKAPYPDIDRVLPYHPPEIEAPAFKGVYGGWFRKKERKLVAVLEKVSPHRPERFPDIATVIALQHRTDTAKLIDNPLQCTEQKNDVLVFLEPVIESPDMRKVPPSDKSVRTCPHKPEKPFEERLERFYFSVGELGGEKAGDLPVAVVGVPVNKLNRVFRSITGEICLVPIVYGFEINIATSVTGAHVAPSN